MERGLGNLVGTLRESELFGHCVETCALQPLLGNLGNLHLWNLVNLYSETLWKLLLANLYFGILGAFTRELLGPCSYIWRPLLGALWALWDSVLGTAAWTGNLVGTCAVLQKLALIWSYLCNGGLPTKNSKDRRLTPLQSLSIPATKLNRRFQPIKNQKFIRMLLLKHEFLLFNPASGNAPDLHLLLKKWLNFLYLILSFGIHNCPIERLQGQCGLLCVLLGSCD